MALFIKLYPENPNQRQVSRIVDILRKGGIAIYPTDTVYALGCDITNTKSLERLAQFKGVKLAKANLSFMCPDFSNLSDYVKQMDNITFRILKQYLPGPYTFILPGSSGLPKEFKKKKTVGIRIPDNAIALEIVKTLGNPMVCTSVHNDDEIEEYITDPDLLYEKWNKLVDVIVDGGFGGNIPSTVVDICTKTPHIIRHGKGLFE